MEIFLYASATPRLLALGSIIPIDGSRIWCLRLDFERSPKFYKLRIYPRTFYLTGDASELNPNHSFNVSRAGCASSLPMLHRNEDGGLRIYSIMSVTLRVNLWERNPNEDNKENSKTFLPVASPKKPKKGKQLEFQHYCGASPPFV